MSEPETSDPVRNVLNMINEYESVCSEIRKKEMAIHAARRCVAKLKAQRDHPDKAVWEAITRNTVAEYVERDISKRRDQERALVSRLVADNQTSLAPSVAFETHTAGSSATHTSTPVMRINVVGTAHTGFHKRFEAPRQPFLGNAAEAEGHLTLTAPSLIPRDLKPDDHLWILFWFDRNAHFRLAVLPPRATTRHGMFATRTPHRPNPVGLTLVRVGDIDREAGVISTIGADLLDCTPILGIRRYDPTMDDLSSRPMGWLSDQTLPLHYDEVKRDVPDLLRPREVRGMDDPPIVARLAAVQAIHSSLDVTALVRAHLGRYADVTHTRRVGAKKEDSRFPGRLTMAVGSFRVVYRVGEAEVLVEDVVSSLPAHVDQAEPEAAAHARFTAQFQPLV